MSALDWNTLVLEVAAESLSFAPCRIPFVLLATFFRHRLSPLYSPLPSSLFRLAWLGRVTGDVPVTSPIHALLSSFSSLLSFSLFKGTLRILFSLFLFSSSVKALSFKKNNKIKALGMLLISVTGLGLILPVFVLSSSFFFLLSTCFSFFF